MSMGLQVTDTSQYCTLVRPTTRSCFPLHLLPSSKILKIGIRRFLEGSKRNYRQLSIYMTGPRIRIISHPLTLLVAKTEISLRQVSVDSSPLFMFGTLNSCNLLPISNLDLLPKVSQHSLLVLVQDT